MLPTQQKRIESIDILRGLVMMLMALDHVRDYFHIGANTSNPLDLQTTYPFYFFTRWITHFCAPIFIFLSGISIYLQGLRKSSKELGLFVFKRGLWLILVEITLVSFGWTFNPTLATTPLQVIWAIGISMVIMGVLLLLKLPYKIIAGLGALIVVGHNLFDAMEQAPGFQSNFWWDLVHHAHFTPYAITSNHTLFLVYAFVPWTGLMMLGYGLGKLFTDVYSAEQRANILLKTGLGLFVFFVALRYTNIYGDPYPWSIQKNTLFTLLSFINIQKYPPSLLYMSLTISIALLLLVWFEKLRGTVADVFTLFGRTAFFYYIIHIYLIHILATLVFFMRGHSFADGLHTGEQFPFLFVAPGEGFELAGVYIVWIVILLLLYPVCKWYDAYKRNHREYWWLSYL